MHFAQTAKCLVADLADTLAPELHYLSHLGHGMTLTIDTVDEGDDLLLTFKEHAKSLRQYLIGILFLERTVGIGCVMVLEQIEQIEVILTASRYGRIDRDRMASANLSCRSLTLRYFVQTSLLLDSFLHRITDNGCGILHKAFSHFRAEAHRSLHHPQVALAHQVVELYPLSAILTSQSHHETQIGFYQLVDGPLVTGLYSFRQCLFFSIRQQCLIGDFIQISIEGILLFHNHLYYFCYKINSWPFKNKILEVFFAQYIQFAYYFANRTKTQRRRIHL